jgi:hypothetical protein
MPTEELQPFFSSARLATADTAYPGRLYSVFTCRRSGGDEVELGEFLLCVGRRMFLSRRGLLQHVHDVILFWE